MSDTATRIGALQGKIGEEVRIQGWLYNVPQLGRLSGLSTSYLSMEPNWKTASPCMRRLE